MFRDFYNIPIYCESIISPFEKGETGERVKKTLKNEKDAPNTGNVDF